MRRNRVAIVVPTYEGHLRYFLNFLQSYIDYNIKKSADLWCIISRKDNVTRYESFASVLVIPDDLLRESDKGIINKKKIYGLISLKEKYEYILVLDDDTVINKNFDLYDFCDDFYKRKVLLGNTATDKEIVPKVIESCERFYEISERESFLNRTGNLYLWFNQPSIYSTKLLGDFFKVTRLENRLAEMLWYDFDYYIYMIYLICFAGFRVVDVKATSTFGICEALDDKEIDIKSSSISDVKFTQLTDYMRKRLSIEPEFLIHVDREFRKKYKFTSELKKLLERIRGLSDKRYN